ncbi:ParA family protein [Microcoleus sp. D3_18a_C4]
MGKTTTAVHLAAYLAAKGDAILIDGDPNRSATGWAKRGQLPFEVVDERQQQSSHTICCCTGLFCNNSRNHRRETPH